MTQKSDRIANEGRPAWVTGGPATLKSKDFKKPDQHNAICAQCPNCGHTLPESRPPVQIDQDRLTKAPDMICPCGEKWKLPAGWGMYRNDEVERLKRDSELLDEFSGRIRQRADERGDKGGRGKEPKKLSPSREKAYQAYQIAVAAGKDGSYREAFEYLLMFGPDEYDLPDRWETFGDYVRQAKRFYEVRAASIPKTPRQIEDLDDITNKYRTD